jgi:hypothetical protein
MSLAGTVAVNWAMINIPVWGNGTQGKVENWESAIAEKELVKFESPLMG